MPKEKPHHGGRPIRGGDSSIIQQTGYSGYIPTDAFNALEHELTGLVHGIATLSIHVKDGNLLRYVTYHERSFVPNKPMTGSGQ